MRYVLLYSLLLTAAGEQAAVAVRLREGVLGMLAAAAAVTTT